MYFPRYQHFIFQSFRFDPTTLTAYFTYGFDDRETFEEQITFACEGFEARNVETKDLDAFLFPL